MTQMQAVAKLARLMPGLPEFIDPDQLAEKKASIEGELALKDMQRLQGLLCDDSGSVKFNLTFGRNAQGRICISGDFSANVDMVCQRCLEVFQTNVANDISIGIVADESGLEELDDDLEPLVLAEKQILLKTLIEEEVLLSLPLAAAHAAELCPAEKLLEDIRVSRENPFAVLKDLKLKDS